jgi:SAM-dependent methyltransferase
VSEPFQNVYADEARAAAYAQLGFPGTYYLAFRDLPDIMRTHVRGRVALDFGCGTGRSTRFLRDMGFKAVGVDIAASMLARARDLDPTGDYRLITEGPLGGLPVGPFDLVLATFTFDNIPTRERKGELLSDLRRVLKLSGRLVLVVSTPNIYVHEWASFSTRDFPENRASLEGGPVRIIMLDVGDRRPVEDVVCPETVYRQLFTAAGLHVMALHLPLGHASDGVAWVSETSVAPWAIYVLAPVEPEADV